MHFLQIVTFLKSSIAVEAGLLYLQQVTYNFHFFVTVENAKIGKKRQCAQWLYWKVMFFQ
jgi:hypothetical protein